MKNRILTDDEIFKYFGEPLLPGDKNLISINLPYSLKIAWDLNKTVNKISCHKKIATPLQNVFNDILNQYGLKKIQELGIDILGGVYNYRKMRGSNRWSRHSWAIAIDLDPNRNGLKTKKPLAQFSKPEYKTMIDIFYKHGFIGYGPEKDYDWMHFEFGQIPV